MDSYPQHFETPTDQCVGDYWTSKPSGWPSKSPVYDAGPDSQHSTHPEYPSQVYYEEHSAEEQTVRPTGSGVPAIPGKYTATAPEIPTKPTSPQAANNKTNLREYTRQEIELQFGTITEYIHNKKLQPILWACCSCSKEQKYRENLDSLDRLRCQYPRCGVSDKGFRIYKVHDLCAGCTVFVDERAPVTKRALKKKRDEVREVLRKIKKVYEDVDCLLGFDDEEAEKIAGLVEQRDAQNALDREKKEETEMRRVEMEKRQREGWIDGDRDRYGQDSVSESEEEGDTGKDEYEEEEHYAEAPRRGQKNIGKPQKKRGLRGLLRF